MESELDQLLAILDLERIDTNLFRGVSPVDGRDRIFGGQVLGQSLMAAQRTVEDREAHSLHGYFLRPGNPKVPIVFDVDRIRDGRSFTTRRVVAIQNGEAIFNMSVSFQVAETGMEHQIDAVIPAEPAGQVYESVILGEVERLGGDVSDDRRFDLPIEVRAPGGLHIFDEAPRPPSLDCWMRAKGTLPDDPALHQCVLAYASDLTVMVSTVYPHPVGMRSRGMQTASLDHAMWFHRDFRADEWLYFAQESPVTAQSRGTARCLIYSRAGTLVSSCVQEGLIRRHERRGRR